MVIITTLPWIKYRPGNLFPRFICLNEESWKVSVYASGFLCLNWATHLFLDGFLNRMNDASESALREPPLHTVLSLHSAFAPGGVTLEQISSWRSAYLQSSMEDATLVHVKQEAGEHGDVIQPSLGLTPFYCYTQSRGSRQLGLLSILSASSDQEWLV